MCDNSADSDILINDNNDRESPWPRWRLTTTLCFKKKLHPFYFSNNFVDPGPIWIILAIIHLRKIVIKPVLYFKPHLFYAPLLYLVTQATNLSDIHSDKHQNRMVKSGKSRDKNADKHSKTSQGNQSKCSTCRPLAFTHLYKFSIKMRSSTLNTMFTLWCKLWCKHDVVCYVSNT